MSIPHSRDDFLKRFFDQGYYSKSWTSAEHRFFKAGEFEQAAQLIDWRIRTMDAVVPSLPVDAPPRSIQLLGERHSIEARGPERGLTQLQQELAPHYPGWCFVRGFYSLLILEKRNAPHVPGELNEIAAFLDTWCDFSNEQRFQIRMLSPDVVGMLKSMVRRVTPPRYDKDSKILKSQSRLQKCLFCFINYGGTGNKKCKGCRQCHPVCRNCLKAANPKCMWCEPTGHIMQQHTVAVVGSRSWTDKEKVVLVFFSNARSDLLIVHDCPWPGATELFREMAEPKRDILQLPPDPRDRFRRRDGFTKPQRRIQQLLDMKHADGTPIKGVRPPKVVVAFLKEGGEPGESDDALYCIQEAEKRGIRVVKYKDSEPVPRSWEITDKTMI